MDFHFTLVFTLLQNVIDLSCITRNCFVSLVGRCALYNLTDRCTRKLLLFIKIVKNMNFKEKLKTFLFVPRQSSEVSTFLLVTF